MAKNEPKEWRPIEEEPPKFRYGSRQAIWTDRLTVLMQNPGVSYRIFTGTPKQAMALRRWLQSELKLPGVWEFTAAKISENEAGVWAVYHAESAASPSASSEW